MPERITGSLIYKDGPLSQEGVCENNKQTEVVQTTEAFELVGVG